MVKKMSDSGVKEVRIGLIGLGTVGSGVYEIIQSHGADIQRKTGIRLLVQKIGVRSFSKADIKTKVPRGLLTTDAFSVARDHQVDILVEVAGGIHPVKEIHRAALRHGKHVVTANKALLAEAGDDLFSLADSLGLKVGFEASVCGGIPLIKAVKEGLVSNRIERLMGIVNGTCNYILTRMSENGADFNTVLAEAQAHGYAEKNPGFDVDGIDSAHKLAVLARLSFGANIPFKKIYVEGIRGLDVADIGYCKELGYVIKLLAIGKKTSEGLQLRVHPTLLPKDHPLAGVRGVYNAVFLHADQVGDQLFYGRGAGKMPTASAVLSDIIDIAKRLPGGCCSSDAGPGLKAANVLPMEQVRSKYYLRFQVLDRPGVLGMIAKTLGQNQISILSVNQKESHAGRSVPVVILTYEATEKNLRKALKMIDTKKEIAQKTTVFRLES